MAAASEAPKQLLGEARAEARCLGEGGQLVIRKTFYHYEEEAERVFRCRSAPAAPRARRPAHVRLSPAAGTRVCEPQPRTVVAFEPGPAGPPSAAEWRTSVLLRNVPYLLSRDMLVELLDSQGFEGKFDLVYLPRDFDRAQTLGYAVVNALEPQIALRLFHVFEGFRAWPLKCLTKICTVDWCHRQGLQNNVRFLRNSSVMHESVPEVFKPVLFLQGSQVPFPPSTKKLRNWRCLRSGTGC